MASLLRYWNLGRRLYSGVTHTTQHVHLACSLNTSSQHGQEKCLPTLTLFTKDVCSLCDDAKEILKKYDGRFVLEEVYIDKPENKKSFSLYKYDIPVFHFNGEFLMKHRVNEELLENKLLEEEKKT